MSEKRRGLSLLEILLITIMILVSCFIFVNLKHRSKAEIKAASSESEDFERKFGFSHSVYPTSYNKQEEVEESKTSRIVRVEVDLSKINFNLEGGTNSL